MNRPAVVERIAGPLLILAIAMIALQRGWGTGPDVLVDFGRELYVPWRLVEGDRLYAEIAHLHAPLSPWFNALAFRLFGVGLSTLLWTNLVITAGIAALLYMLLQQISDRVTAAVAVSLFVGVFAFGQTNPVGNYDYLTPYSHELTHGLLIALVALWLFSRRGVRDPRLTFAMGFVTGLAFLTKTEVFAALLGSVVVGLLLEFLVYKETRRQALHDWVRFVGALMVAPLAAFTVLAFSTSPAIAVEGLFDPWFSIFDSRVSSLMYYRWIMGTLDPEASRKLIVSWSLIYLAALIPLAALALALRGRLKQWGLPVAVAIAVLVLGLILLRPIALPLSLQAIRPLSLVMPLILLGALWQLRRTWRSGGNCERDILSIVLVTFALGIQFKIFFNTRFFHYGFVLAMPSTLILVTAIVGWLPTIIQSFSGSKIAFRAGAIGAVLYVALGVAEVSQRRLSEQFIPVAKGRDAFRTDHRGREVRRALAYLEANSAAEETLAVLPEGVMLNYLLRRTNPTPYINFMPPEFILYGDDEIVAAFERNPPDRIALVHKVTSLYGFRFFGVDYGVPLGRWVEANYELEKQFGDRPFRDASRFGIAILKRREGISDRARMVE